MPAGHADLLDGIYGDWGKGLRGPEFVPVTRNPARRFDSGFIGQIVWEGLKREVRETSSWAPGQISRWGIVRQLC